MILQSLTLDAISLYEKPCYLNPTMSHQDLPYVSLSWEPSYTIQPSSSQDPMPLSFDISNHYTSPLSIGCLDLTIYDPLTLLLIWYNVINKGWPNLHWQPYINGITTTMMSTCLSDHTRINALSKIHLITADGTYPPWRHTSDITWYHIFYGWIGVTLYHEDMYSQLLYTLKQVG